MPPVGNRVVHGVYARKAFWHLSEPFGLSDLALRQGVLSILRRSFTLGWQHMDTKNPKPDDPEQSKRFIDAAREAEADETEEGADRAFKKVVSQNKKTLAKRSNQPI
jgi:hypothetical protein